MAHKSTLAESTAAAIRNEIRQGTYLSGERLVELTLARLLEVSQNTVRDALRILEHEGWVVKHARHGVFVRQFTMQEAVEVYALLQTVEPLALDWAIDGMTRSALDDLTRLIERAHRSAQREDRGPAIEALLQFHEHIGQIAGHTMTAQLMEQLYNRVRLLETIRQRQAPVNLRDLEAHITRHGHLLTAIKAGERSRAQALLREQLATYSALSLALLQLD
jgi:DNA-binding GntR family transcriptional regulator